jgi:NitT/TauT family transport system permease protein
VTTDTDLGSGPRVDTPSVVDGAGPAPVPRPRPLTGASRSRTMALSVVPPLALGGVIIGLWYYVSNVVLDPSKRFLLKPPHQVVNEGFLKWDNLSELLTGLWNSAKVAGMGLAIAILIGFLLATVMSQSKLIERAAFPYLVTAQAIPILAIVPLIGFWFKYGTFSRVFVCVIIAIFPIIVNTLFGLQSAERGMHDLFTLHHASRLTRLRKLMFPGALPAVFAGLRISAGLSVIGAIVGDFFFGQGEVGIGQLLKRYQSRIEGEMLLAAVIMTSAFGVAVFLFFGWLQNRAIGKWYEAGQSG